MKLRGLMQEENSVIDSEELVEELGATENEPQVEEESEVETELDNAESSEEEAEQDDSKEQVKEAKNQDLPKGVQKTINKLTKLKHQQKAEIESLKAQLEQAQKFLDTPEPENLDSLSESERFKYYTQKSIAENAVAQTKAQTQQTEARHKLEAWNTKVAEKLDVFPDFQAVVNEGIPKLKLSEEANTEIFDFITDSDVGVELAHYLFSNTEETNELNNLSPKARDRKLTTLQIKLELGLIGKPTKPSAQKKVTSAQAPVSRSKGQASSAVNPANLRGQALLDHYRAQKLKG